MYSEVKSKVLFLKSENALEARYMGTTTKRENRALYLLTLLAYMPKFYLLTLFQPLHYHRIVLFRQKIKIQLIFHIISCTHLYIPVSLVMQRHCINREGEQEDEGENKEDEVENIMYIQLRLFKISRVGCEDTYRHIADRERVHIRRVKIDMTRSLNTF